MPDIIANIAETGKHIDVFFRYDAAYVRIAKSVTGGRFLPAQKGGPAWRYPLDLTVARRLREGFGAELRLAPALREWGHAAVREESTLRSLTKADDVPLADLRISDRIPKLAQALRGYQRADVKLMANRNILNGNEQGLGKTLETIAAVYESGQDEGPKLVCAPGTSLETVWADEIERWTFSDDTSQTIYLLDGESTEADRQEILEAVLSGGHNYWLLTTAYWLRWVEQEATTAKRLQRAIAGVKWSAMILDEFHRFGLTNATGSPDKGTQFSIALKKIEANVKYGLSGTPIGGKPIKFWGALHWLRSDIFTSKWRWAEEWLDITDNGFGKEIGQVIEHRENQFYDYHSQFMLRRLKAEVAPELPAKQYVDVWCHMGRKQKAAYNAFKAEAAIRLNDIRVDADNVLAEATRLKQLANALCSAERRTDGTIRMIPDVTESAKFSSLVERLAEIGITGDKDAVGDSVTVVGSMSKEMVDAVHAGLVAKGIKAEKITGDTKQRDRADIIRRFQRAVDPPRVICLTTTAGGVAITLDRADTIHILDEGWVPDEQRQLEDRVHRVSRIHQVTVYTYRTKETIDENIDLLNQEKQQVNDLLLDELRQEAKVS